MMSQLEPFLDMNLDYVLQQDRENVRYYEQKRKRVRPWSFGEYSSSRTNLHKIKARDLRPQQP